MKNKASVVRERVLKKLAGMSIDDILKSFPKRYKMRVADTDSDTKESDVKETDKSAKDSLTLKTQPNPTQSRS